MIEMLSDQNYMDELMTRYCMITNPRQVDYQFPLVWDELNKVKKDTRLSVRPEQKFAVFYDDDRNFASLVIRGREIDLDDIPKAALEAVLSAQGEKSISGREILELNDGLKWKKLRK